MLPFSLTEYTLYCLGALALVMSPGPDFFYVITRGMAGGRAAGVFSALGIAAGLVVHTTLAASGLTLLVLTSHTAFLVLKWIGAAYLLWMGIRMLRSKDAFLPSEAVPKAQLAAVFRQGVLTNILNPKVALTFAAFLPPFVHPERGAGTLQIAILGATLCVLSLIWFSLVGAFAGRFGDFVARHPRFSSSLRIGAGCALAALGIRLALAQRGQSETATDTYPLPARNLVNWPAVILRFLGTGTSYGVPYIGCDCPVCHSDDPRDKRLRACVMLENESQENPVRLLVDTGPDFRQQMLRANVRQLTAVLWTHLHNDHIIGLDDIRPLTDRQGYIPGYADAPTMERLKSVFDYVFVQGRDHGGFPRVTPHILEPKQEVIFSDITVTPLTIYHGQRRIFSYEFAQGNRRIVYATDCSGIPSESLERMKGCDVFVVDALRHARHPNHFSVQQALEAIEKIQPGRAYFTHLTHDLPHAETEASLPDGVKISYDGLEVEV